jgi:hypothetical protein
MDTTHMFIENCVLKQERNQLDSYQLEGLRNVFLTKLVKRLDWVAFLAAKNAATPSVFQLITASCVVSQTGLVSAADQSQQR